MLETEEQIEHLTLRALTSVKPETSGPSVLILGNAYGIMPYQKPLATLLFKLGYAPYWFSFSGQHGTPGQFSLASGVRDIALTSSAIRRRGHGRNYILAHCASGVMTIEYLQRQKHECTERVAIYGLLFNPERRRESAVPQLLKAGVNTAIEEDAWRYKTLDALPNVSTPILFCHASDQFNLARSTFEEISAAAEAARSARVVWFDHGYDKALDNLPAYVSVYHEWFSEANESQRKGIDDDR